MSFYTDLIGIFGEKSVNYVLPYLHHDPSTKVFMNNRFIPWRDIYGRWLIGNVPFIIENDCMFLLDERYFLTTGILELLFKNNPDLRCITDIDKEDYNQIIRSINFSDVALKKYYNGQISQPQPPDHQDKQSEDVPDSSTPLQIDEHYFERFRQTNNNLIYP